MSRVIATMPGRFGDILWALPTVRALAERYDQPVELYVSKKYGDESFLKLIAAQDYIEKVEALEDWIVEETAPMSPRTPPGLSADLSYHDLVHHHLGYPSWPTKPLPHSIAGRTGVAVDLTKPWIASSLYLVDVAPGLTLGWSAEWKELKYGLTSYLSWCSSRWGGHPSLYWSAEAGSPYLGLGAQERDWVRTAETTANARVFLGDLSAQWVLACALGVPAVIVEPEPMRHGEIFWVDIKDEKGRRMTRIVKGHDGKPTFDWNHVRDELKAAWEEFEP